MFNTCCCQGGYCRADRNVAQKRLCCLTTVRWRGVRNVRWILRTSGAGLMIANIEIAWFMGTYVQTTTKATRWGKKAAHINVLFFNVPRTQIDYGLAYIVCLQKPLYGQSWMKRAEKKGWKIRAHIPASQIMATQLKDIIFVTTSLYYFTFRFSQIWMTTTGLLR